MASRTFGFKIEDTLGSKVSTHSLSSVALVSILSPLAQFNIFIFFLQSGCSSSALTVLVEYQVKKIICLFILNPYQKLPFINQTYQFGVLKAQRYQILKKKKLCKI